MRTSFLTGSRIYGSPTKKSDLDLCILVSKSEAQIIKSYSDAESISLTERGYNDDVFTCRYGMLNIIMFTDESMFDVWQNATKFCINRKPVTRDFAKAVIIFRQEMAKHEKKKDEPFFVQNPDKQGN